MRDWLHRAARWLSPAGFLLVAVCFLLPFVAVACDAPGGFGRVEPGGTTTYTGFDLVTGGEPDVTADRLRPPAARRDDRLGPQPLAIAVIVLVAAGVVSAVALPRRRSRRAAGAALAAVAALLLVANQATVVALLAARLREQLTVPMPAEREAGDFVKSQNGFWLALILLVALAAANAIGLARRRQLWRRWTSRVGRGGRRDRARAS
jgi:hypothetical protein